MSGRTDQRAPTLLAIDEPDAQTIDRARLRFVRARRAGFALALVLAVGLSTSSGLGLAVSCLALLLGIAWGIGFRSTTARWCASAGVLAPWLTVRDNTWLLLCIIFTVVLVAFVSAFGAATEQRLGDLSVGAIWRRVRPRPIDAPPALGESERTAVALVRGAVIATPIVLVFWALLASSDEVFAEIADPSIVPVGRGGLFLVVLPLCLGLLRFAVIGRPSQPAVPRPAFGSLESSVVLTLVSALFTLFISLRAATIGRELSDAALRSEVRSGFFQLLWVVALTVVLVLAIRQIAGAPTLERHVRRLSLLTIFLAAVIDGLAMLKIADYVSETFLSPLRFWSFGFGLWLLVVLALTALRVAGVRAGDHWFTAALVSSWMVFVFAMGAVNPDRRIAEHNFANPPTGEDEWIAVKPLMWLSEDATPTIVENVEVLRPMPNDRYERMVEHLCLLDDSDGWRDAHLSRTKAREAIEPLC